MRKPSQNHPLTQRTTRMHSSALCAQCLPRLPDMQSATPARTMPAVLDAFRLVQTTTFGRLRIKKLKATPTCYAAIARPQFSHGQNWQDGTRKRQKTSIYQKFLKLIRLVRCVQNQLKNGQRYGRRLASHCSGPIVPETCTHLVATKFDARAGRPLRPANFKYTMTW